MADKEIAFRQPPGDRWRIENSDVLYTNLTNCLNHIYMKYEVTEFRIDAKKGVIYIDDGVEVEPVIETYSLYGER